MPLSSFVTTGPGSVDICKVLGKVLVTCSFPKVCASVLQSRYLSPITFQSNSFAGDGVDMGPEALRPQSCTGDFQ